jgi:Na+-transporting NADH:ubiquinone oxidoreductase subunit C
MMHKDSPKKALLVVFLTALVCSSLVSAAVVLLRPIQLNNQLLERSRNIMQMSGLVSDAGELEDDELLELYKNLDGRIVNIGEAVFDEVIDANTFDKRRAANDPELGVSIPANLDQANLGRRSQFAPVYFVWNESGLERVILPVRGAGMWSMLYGYIALESDLNTIAGMTFYEQNETPGLGDQITHGHWLEQWQGRRIYDERGSPRFRVSEGAVEDGSATAGYQVDALTGATVTGNAVTSLMHYWFGPHGYQEFLIYLRERPPERPAEGPG